MADLREILGQHYFSKRLETTMIVGRALNRSEIEQVLQENGYTLPLANSVEFFIIDANDKRFRVLYSIESDAFSYEKYRRAN